MRSLKRLKSFFDTRQVSIHSAGPGNDRVQSRPWLRSLLAVAAISAIMLHGNLARAAETSGPHLPGTSISTVSETVVPISISPAANVLPGVVSAVPFGPPMPGAIAAAVKAVDTDQPVPSITELAKTKNSKFLSEMTERFGGALGPEMPIAFLDHDAAVMEQWLLMARTSPQTGPGPINIQLLGRAHGTINASLTLDARDGLESDDAYSQKIEVGKGFYTDDPSVKGVCLVIPADPNVSAFDDAAMMMGFDATAARKLGPNLYHMTVSTDLVLRYTVYHETGHCLEDKYIGDGEDLDGEAYYHRRTQGESFADVTALMLLAREGHPEYLDTVLKERAIGADTRGSYWARSKTAEGMSRYNGLVHFTSFALIAAQEKIQELGPEALQKMSYNDILKTAGEIVKNRDMNMTQYNALFKYFEQGEAYRNELKAKLSLADAGNAALEPTTPTATALGLNDTMAKIARLQKSQERLDIEQRLAFLDAYDKLVKNSYDSVLGDKRILSDPKREPRHYEYRQEAMANWDAIMKSAQAKGGGFKNLAAAYVDFMDKFRSHLDDATATPKPVAPKPMGPQARPGF